MATKINIMVENWDDLRNVLKVLADEKIISYDSYVNSWNELCRAKYPINVPVDLTDVMNLIRNPIIKKMFGGKIQTVANSCIQKFIEAKG